MSTVVFGYEPRTFSDPTALAEGLHPAFLVQVTDEVKPDGWKMQTERMWRFNFGVWDNVNVIHTTPPELQTKTCSQTFSSGGKFQASNAYVYMKAALNRDIAPREKIDPNALVPLPVMLYVVRLDSQNRAVDFAIIKDVRPWAEGNALLTPEFKAQLMAWWASKQPALEEARAAVAAQTPATPNMTTTPTPPAAVAVTPPPAPSGKAGW